MPNAIEKLKNIYDDGEIDNEIDDIKQKIHPLNEFSARFNISLSGYYADKALRELFVNNNSKMAKQYFYLFGKSIEIGISKFNKHASLNLIVKDATYILLSNNIDLIKRFSFLKDSEYETRLSKGALVPCIQAVIREDWSFLKNQIDICRSTIATKKSGMWINSDLQALEGIMEKDNEKIESAINILATKEHKKRNDESIVNELISIPAIGYAKLAWLKGIEIDIDHPLIPKELLPINPNNDYWDYDYMKQEEFICKN